MRLLPSGRGFFVVLLAQAGDTPPFTSWAQFVIFLVAVGVTVNWVWRFLRDKRYGEPRTAAQDALSRDYVTLASQVAEMAGRLSERTVTQGDAIESLWRNVATVDTRISQSASSLSSRFTAHVLEAEERLSQRLDRLEARLEHVELKAP